jgi:predicted AlkP superfamily pyrophosphatase or phosphodiesterase
MTDVSRVRSALAGITLVLAGCRAEPVRAPDRRPPRGERATSTLPDRPRLVLSVVIDQLPAWAMERYLPYLSPTGAIRRGITQGVYAERVAYDYASTYTAPGHAAIYSGASPSESGIYANDIYDRETRRDVASVADSAYPIFGVSDRGASPLRLRARTVADALKASSAGKARVVSLSIKDRAAILPGGQHPDLALWYEKSTGSFTTSRYYAERVPAFVAAVPTRLGDWMPSQPELYQRLLGPDDAPGEGDWLGLGTVFPHHASAVSDKASVFRATPDSNHALFWLARRSVAEFGLGNDEVPDLLAVSLSATDYAAHVFGPDSWEYLDLLLAADRELADFIDELGAHTRLAILLTSDHGAAHLPERSLAQGKTAGRIFPKVLARELEDFLAKKLGPGPWVDTCIEPFVYLSDQGRSPEHREAVVAATIGYLGSLESIARAFDPRKTKPESGDPVERAVAMSAGPDAPGDVFLVPALNFIVDPDVVPGKGTSHGSPWQYDREVPLIVWGVGVKPGRVTEVVDFRTIAATLAALLGVPAPATARARPLQGVATAQHG